MLKFNFLLFIGTLLSNALGFSQVSGCTDVQATNFDSNATENDGSCVYPATTLTSLSSVVLSDTLHETSGLIHWNDLLWTHNDNTDEHLYAIDQTSGQIQQRINIPAVTNTDWEEISQDADYLYLGDVGNNLGNRTDLKILRIQKSTFMSGVIEIDTIQFSYSNQTDFTPASNSTNFDCEAFIVTENQIYLFTKRWGDKKTFCYSLEKTPGIHSAVLMDSLNMQGLVTAANYDASKKMLVLLGYSTTLQPFLFALYDFEDEVFFQGNKRKFATNIGYHQAEGISTNDGLHYFVSNEYFSNSPITTQQRLHQFDLTEYFSSYYFPSTTSIDTKNPTTPFQFSENPAENPLIISFSSEVIGREYEVTDIDGKQIRTGKIESEQLVFELPKGFYFFRLEGFKPEKFQFD